MSGYDERGYSGGRSYGRSGDRYDGGRDGGGDRYDRGGGRYDRGGGRYERGGGDGRYGARDEPQEPSRSDPPQERKRLQLKPRSKEAGKAGGYSSKRSGSRKSNPFGAARPREQVLAAKGIDWKKKDNELSKRLAKLPRMSAKQEEEFRAMEAEIKFAEAEIAKATSPDQKAKAQEEHRQKLKDKNEFLDKLKDTREYTRPSERRARDEEGGGDDRGGDFSNFGKRDRGGSGSFGRRDRGGSSGGDQDSKVFVGSLAWGVDDMTLGEEFSKAGFTVTAARVVMDREDPHRSRGFGYVTLADKAEVSKALEMMNGFEICGRPIRVDVATSRSRSSGGGYGRRDGGQSGGYGQRDGGYGSRDGGYGGSRDGGYGGSY